MLAAKWIRRSALLVAVVASLAAMLFVAGRTDAQPKSGLPGAKPVIEAANYSSLHAAFEAASKKGGLLRLPAGEFHIEKPLLVFGGDVAVVGAGTSTHIINDNKLGEPAILAAHPLAKRTGGADRKHNLWRVRFSHLRITGGPNSGHGIEARYINEILIDDVTVSENGGDGIRLDYCYEDPRICDSLITYNKQVGVNLLGCHDIVVSANQFEENNDALHCVDGFNLTMSGNNLDDHLSRGVVIHNTYGSVVSANMIEECAGEAIVLDRDCYGITLSANVIAHNGAGIDLRDAHGCAVSANTLTLMQSHAVRISSKSSRITICGNSFCDSYIGEGAMRRKVGDQKAGGLIVDGASHVGVTGNVFSSVSPHALTIGEKAKGLLFANNVIVDATLQKQPVEKSSFQGNLSDASSDSDSEEKNDKDEN